MRAAGAAYSFPQNGIIDNFNRADEGPPPSASWGGLVFPASDGEAVISNVCACPSGAAGFASSYYNTSYGPDCEVYVKIAAVSNFEGCLLRVSNPNNASITGYELLAKSDNTIRVRRFDNSGSATQIFTVAQAVANGDSVGMNAIGNVITVYYKSGAGAWTSMGTADGSAYTSAGFLGVETDGTSGATLDDFGGGTIV